MKQTKIVTDERYGYYSTIQKTIPKEHHSLLLLESVQSEQVSAQRINNIASVLGYLPNITIGIAGVGRDE